MAESFLPQQRDRRTFGAMQARLLDDLNRPDLSSLVIDYLQDAMRFFARKAFFFTEMDNKPVPVWAPGTMYPLGCCIQAVPTGGGLNTYVALSAGTQSSGTATPTWPTTIYVPPPGSGFTQPPPGTPGTVVDNGVIWGNLGPYKQGIHTQLSTVPGVNQYTPPLDWAMPYMVQVTTANLRLVLEKVSFFQLSEWDVVRPAPIAAYPQFWAYWQQQIYFWVYPSGFFPITLNYNTAPILPQAATDSNFWTTIAERMVRKYAQAIISREILYDQSASQLAITAASEELNQLKAQAVAQQGYHTVSWDW